MEINGMTAFVAGLLAGVVVYAGVTLISDFAD